MKKYTTKDYKLFDKFTREELDNDLFWKDLCDKAKRAFKQVSNANFDNESWFGSSSDVHGFYFPSLNSDIRCIAFIKGEPVVVYDDETITKDSAFEILSYEQARDYYFSHVNNFPPFYQDYFKKADWAIEMVSLDKAYEEHKKTKNSNNKEKGE